MPGFISHTVQAKDIYKRLKNDVMEEYLMTYSLGGDLTKYAKCRYDTHHKKQDDFIYALANYIKSHKLSHDKALLGVLYGHICHYMMDDTLHPLIRKISKSCGNTKHNHTLVELYYDEFLVKEVFNESLNSYLKKPILKAKYNKKVKDMLNMVYDDVYQVKNIFKYYRFNLFLYRFLKSIYKVFGYKFIKIITKLDKFVSQIDIINQERKICYKDYKSNDCNLELKALYEESVKRTIAYIERINKYLEI